MLRLHSCRRQIESRNRTSKAKEWGIVRYSAEILEKRFLFAVQYASSTLHTFVPLPSGEFPSGVVMDAAGNLFGTTNSGGPAGDGTIFELAAGSNSVTTLASFSSATGYQATGLTLDPSGNLYGTT